MKKFNSLKNNIPLPIRLFLGKALLFFIAWKIIYVFFLFDSQYLDSILTKHVGNSSVKVLNGLGSMSGFTAINETYPEIHYGEIQEFNMSVIYHNDKKILNIANACNGLELIILYIGFIICMPSSFLRKVLYIIIGVILIDFINIIRCVGLIYLREYFQQYFQFAHHYLFKIIVYSTTFIMWIVYSRKIQLKNESIQVG
ncbi:archaeosortase/exosortase family protein [Mariniflexile gromovii]|uniref:Archaeosortase/exosortase family protein n=1 Tax=Mariniflexile gromovii TaxID=362523 RepID=A0ABS4BNZ1_9FLAO|nr:archaeosortase/exosortase family protein [Mariniflexile gromovii]MBP0902266.1 archaeosortase/exosortase family protein [Mariniflexile gromovii]